MRMFSLEDSVGVLKDYIPLSERQDEVIQLTPVTRLSKITNEQRKRNSAYDKICEIGEEYMIEEEISAEKTFLNVHTLLEARHDLWYNALINNLSDEWLSMPPETKFPVFCEKMLGITDVPKILNLTPDIMLLSADGRTVFLGDVAVTRAKHIVDDKKTGKYDKLVKFIIEQTTRYCVVQHNMIIMESVENVETVMNYFKNIQRIISLDYHHELDVEITKSANTLISLMERNCREMGLYNELKEKIKYSRSETTSKVSDLMNKTIQDKKLDSYMPIRQEKELIAMIKNKVESLGGVNYYDTSSESIDQAFEDVLVDNEMTEEMQQDGTIKKVKKKVTLPKSTLKVCENSHSYVIKTGLELIEEYVQDISRADPCETRDYMLSLLPSQPQIKMMKLARDKKMKRQDIKKNANFTQSKVGGVYQYHRLKRITNTITVNFERSVTEGCKKLGRLNEKKAVTRLDPDSTDDFISFIDGAVKYYGETSAKPPIVDDSWNTNNRYEEDNTKQEKIMYDYVRSTNGAQTCHAMSALFDRITHMTAHMGTFDNIFTPPNSSFVAIMPSNHAPVTTSNCDMPFLFITRASVRDVIKHIEYEYKVKTPDYVYYISKLCRLNVRTISCWDNAGFRLVASATYLLTRSPSLEKIKGKVVGLLTFLTLDIHQKVSEYLDLLKYIGFMPFSDLHLLKFLIKDKCNLIMKTKMDVWIFNRIREFIKELSDKEKLDAYKPMLQTNNGMPTKESLGLYMRLPSFCDPSIRHDKPDEYIEEMNVLNTSRPKHLYGSQFSDVSTHNTVSWNIDFDNEVEKYGNWATDGRGDGDFPFDAKFCFSADAIHYATKELEQNITEGAGRIENRIVNGQYGEFMHNNCTLKGCTKEVEDRGKQSDIHTSSIASCFERYEKDGYVDDKARVLSIGQDFILSNRKMEFSMSEKDQRGSGRPIATPTLTTKACLMLIEKPEAELGRYMPNNILVAGKDKLKEQHQAYTLCVAEGIRMGLKKVYQLTEDQTKYSENDNTRKYLPYIQSNTLMPLNVRKVQIEALKKMTDRVHLVKRLPKSVTSDSKLMNECIDDETHLGVTARIGWPQGMLNNLSTSVHCAADYWILKAFRLAYPRNHRITAIGLVHSDDSWVTVCCNSLETFKLFSLFRTVAKKMFCLKLNEKKLWGGKYLGELVSHYNLNGHVHMSTGKVICNGMSNLTYQNWPIDVSNQISTLQQAYRAGARLSDLIMIYTLGKQQMIGAYQVNGLHRELLHHLPVELGGFPSGSVFRLAISGIHAHYSDVHKMMTMTSTDDELIDKKNKIVRIISSAVMISKSNRTPPSNAEKTDLKDDDYLSIEIPTKGEIFRGVKHIMPKSKKVAISIQIINKTCAKFESDGLALIITKPKTLAESIGHYGETAKSRQFELAAEKHNQSHRKLASSQAMQSAGKVMRLGSSVPMTFNEALESLLLLKVDPIDIDAAGRAMETDNEIVVACDTIVKTATLEKTTRSKGKVINRMPEIDNVYKTVSPLQDVLLTIIDKYCGTNYCTTYRSNKTSLDTLISDMNNIESRFSSYFSYFDSKTACKLIMQGKMSTIKERTWIQPKVSSESIPNFLEDLYGVTMHRDIIYRVRADRTYMTQKRIDKDTVHDIYTSIVMNDIYPGKIRIEQYNKKSIKDALHLVDNYSLDYNSSLKYAICQKLLNNNNDYLHDLISTEKFAYEWLQTQILGDDGKYRGDWKVRFMYADIVCTAECIANTIRLYVNKLSVPKLLKGMRLMTIKCFSNMIYEYDTGWWNSKLWGVSQYHDVNAHQYLCFYNPYDTQFKRAPSDKCLNVYVQSNNRLDNMTHFVKPNDYIFAEHFRIVKGVVRDVSGNDVSFRVANVFQDFGFINPNKVELITDWIDGFLNHDLIKYGVLEDVTLGRPLTISKQNTLEMLEQNVSLDMKSTLWKTFFNSYYYGKKLPRLDPTTIFEDKTIKKAEGITIDLVESDVKKVDQTCKQTDVESLESMSIDYVTSRLETSKKLNKTDSLIRTLCGHMYSHSPPEYHLDFIFGVMNSTDLYNWFKLVSEDDVLTMNNRIDEIMFVPYDRTLFYFIYGLKLDVTNTWNIMRDKMTQRKRDLRNVARLKDMVENLLKAFNSNYFDEPRDTPRRSVLDDLMDENQDVEDNVCEFEWDD
ncbi:RNA-dependent RNA polymerase [Flen virus]|uniref:RNA-directed RNA polymerase L n=1 Tax=Flen virus TaxID=3070912 RepID=A0A5Q0V0G0_9VIRU|nr:RNA-dependent RNA polymerase [Flen virus]QGA87322.1 RNA-dependent RNA polymerase [Flen virus]